MQVIVATNIRVSTESDLKIFVQGLYGGLVDPKIIKNAMDCLLDKRHLIPFGHQISKNPGEPTYSLSGFSVKPKGYSEFFIDLRSYPKEELVRTKDPEDEGWNRDDLRFEVETPTRVVEYYKNIKRKVLEPGKGLLSEGDLKKMKAQEEPEQKSNKASETLTLPQALEKIKQLEQALSAANARIRELEGTRSVPAGSEAIGLI